MHSYAVVVMVHPWDAAFSEDEWRTWLAAGRDFGQLVVADPAGWPAVVPTHFTVDDERTVLVHLARPNPVWRLIAAQPRVVLTVVDDDAYVPTTWRGHRVAQRATVCRRATPPQCSCAARRRSWTTRRTRRSCCAGSCASCSQSRSTPRSA